jgi:uncharacterized membrane protein YgaE (UPF0421/DUF939 family)
MTSLLQNLTGGVRHALMSALAALIAYLPVHMLGGSQAFWGAITAIGVVQTEFHASANSASNQSIGGVVGGLLGLGMFLLFGDGLGTFLAAVFLSVTTCWLLRVPTASQLSGVTATIILLVPHTGTPQDMLVERLSEVGCGVASGLTVVWLAARLPFAPKSA